MIMIFLSRKLMIRSMIRPLAPLCKLRLMFETKKGVRKREREMKRTKIE